MPDGKWGVSDVPGVLAGHLAAGTGCDRVQGSCCAVQHLLCCAPQLIPAMA